MTTLVAQCSNCASWRVAPAMGGHVSTDGMGYCSKGKMPDAGQVLCSQYNVSHTFQQHIISTMLKEQGPMAMPVRLVGGRKSAKGHNKKKR